jgi:integrase
LDEKCPKTARPKETESMIGRLNEFFGDMVVSDIRGKLCREFADDRGNEGGARRDLEVLRAAVNYYHGEHTLDMVPKITLPEKGSPRQRWLTRQEVARLLRAARKTKQCRHLVRLILIGLYTGTRLSAVLNLQWMPNINGGHIDLDKGVIYRKAEGERVAHNKRKTPVKVPPRLLRFLRYWHKADERTDDEGRTIRLRYVVNYAGGKITKPHKAFRTIRSAAKFADDVTPHVLRHTRATWLAQAGIDAHEAAASLGLTVEEFERTYSHASPDFQKSAANAF